MTCEDENNRYVLLNSPWARLRAWVIVIVLLVLVATSLNAGFTLWTVSNSDHQWCKTLNLLTSQPVQKPTNPKSNPSRQGQYELYQDFVALRNYDHC